jgi:hypothetical protein
MKFTNIYGTFTVTPLFLLVVAGGCDGKVRGGTTTSSRVAEHFAARQSMIDMQPPEPMVVLISLSRYNGTDVGGVAGAHAHCQGLADTDNLTVKGKTFEVWISDGVTSSPASSFYKSSGEYQDPWGNVIADNWADLVDSIAVNEKGGLMSNKMPGPEEEDPRWGLPTMMDGQMVVILLEAHLVKGGSDQWEVDKPTPTWLQLQP